MAIVLLFFCSACSDEKEIVENQQKRSQNPVNTYMDSRVNMIENARSALIDSNRHTKEQEEIVNTILK